MQNGDIWLIDDDEDDLSLLQEALDELNIKNKLRGFSTGKDVIQTMEHISDSPFLILCDVNLGAMTGFELRKEMISRRNKIFHSVPFIYWSTSASESQIEQAYGLSTHGFFIKEKSFSEMKVTVSQIISYWQKSKSPEKKDAGEVTTGAAV